MPFYCDYCLAKYIIITGGVLSSVGKGTVAASIGMLLKRRNIRITVVKVDPYINVDAGTMNPYMHGEVFVTEDGAETDLDLGHYERFIGINVTKYNNITAGKVYFEVINKERKGEYLGQTVQIIPHVTREIISMIKKAGEVSNADVVIVEIGGTVGDIESLPFLEAVRQMKLDEENNLVFVHVALAPYMKVTGELKTKPLQHSVQELRRIGIQPDLIIVRSEVALDQESRNKIALFTNVKPSFIFSSYDVATPYEVPLVLENQGISEKIMKMLDIPKTDANLDDWVNFVSSLKDGDREVNIVLIGKYTKLKDTYMSIREALIHASASLHIKPKLVWVESTDLEDNDEKLKEIMDKADGVIVLPGFGARGTEGKIKAIKYVRENNIPFLGICFGFQLAVVEFARDVLSLKDANSTEINPSTTYPVITMLDDQKRVVQVGGTMRLGSQKIILKEGSIANKIYGSKVIYERHRHRYEVNPEYVDALQKAGLVISGVSENGLVEFIELPNKKFFVATQAHPEFKSRPMSPSPLYVSFLKASMGKDL
ncbi:CTP synthase [Sulfuracidifex metallicus]|uniref:CTP synthase n=1 Tax=Sulfuracidifex metallicus DSM 6482 = JCM 9184 TaxID=523847 RepID=A0A6A9QN37_SULME|nr:CTP synthase [Sulfuracidifex metallicus]MUN28685.1 CTP synthase [Sulfuracidifex metallicus DSM 6482 = JCM 9184]WOE50791.1 CTP synthase [Sulfuracidifex metallicus DSM 6482 = JCM 9184]